MFIEERIDLLSAEAADLKQRSSASEEILAELVSELAAAKKALAKLQKKEGKKSLKKRRQKLTNKYMKLRMSRFGSNLMANRKIVDYDESDSGTSKIEDHVKDRGYARQSTIKVRGQSQECIEPSPKGNTNNGVPVLENHRVKLGYQMRIQGRRYGGPKACGVQRHGNQNYAIADHQKTASDLGRKTHLFRGGYAKKFTGPNLHRVSMVETFLNNGTNFRRICVQREFPGSPGVSGPNSFVVPNVARIIRELEANECGICGVMFRTDWGLRRHQLACHLDIDMNKYRCSVCAKGFPYQDMLQRHLMYHVKLEKGKKFACLHCGKCFLSNSDMLIHERIHTGARPFVCGTCRKTFVHMSHLTKHIITHMK